MKKTRTMAIVGITLTGLAAAGLLLAGSPSGDLAATQAKAPAMAADPPVPTFETSIREVSGAPRVLTTATNYLGEPMSASCSSCHATTTPNRELTDSTQLKKFHQGMHFAHGSQSCLNCHNEKDYDTLRLANGKAVEYVDVMTLCGQCHGPQLRDYQRGLHGGMNGHWDLNRGPRSRNNCIHCHDPHAPAFPLVLPVLPPKDRLAGPQRATSSGH